MTQRIDAPPSALPPAPADFFLNRELGILAFNRRVLAQARNTQTPLLERLQGTALPLPDGLDLGALLAPNLTLED